MASKILIVDDEADLLRLVAYNLRQAGFETIEASSGKEALKQIQAHNPDLVILDWMLPDHSGTKVCQKLRENDNYQSLPVIMLTARSSEDDRITGLEAGADDYVVKPFSPRELVLRVKALLNRTKKKPLKDDCIDLGIFKIFPQDHLVETEDGQSISLTSLEFELLVYLASAPNRVRTREQLIQTVWQDAGDDLNDRAVDTQIKRLRKKLGDDRQLIETIRGVGYRLVIEKLPGKTSDNASLMLA